MVDTEAPAPLAAVGRVASSADSSTIKTVFEVCGYAIVAALDTNRDAKVKSTTIRGEMRREGNIGGF